MFRNLLKVIGVYLLTVLVALVFVEPISMFISPVEKMEPTDFVYAENVQGLSFFNGVISDGSADRLIDSSTVESSAVVVTGRSTSCTFQNRDASVRIDIRFNGDTSPWPIWAGQVMNTNTAGQPLIISSFTHTASSNCTNCLSWACTQKN